MVALHFQPCCRQSLRNSQGKILSGLSFQGRNTPLLGGISVHVLYSGNHLHSLVKYD